MEAYAVIETGGKQYLVHENQVIQVERLAADEGAAVTLDKVLARHNGTGLDVGAPYLDGAAVLAHVMEHDRDTKVVSFKMKRRKGYRRKKGHRQAFTRLKIRSLHATPGEAPVAVAAPEPEETPRSAAETVTDVPAPAAGEE